MKKTMTVTIRIGGLIRGMVTLWAVKMFCRVVGVEVTAAHLSENK